MAQYVVQHACGHSHNYSLFGKHSERDRKLEWLAEQDCPRCRNTEAGPQVWIKGNAAATGGEDFLEVAVTNSFAVKDELRKMGFSFTREIFTYTGNDLVKQAMQTPQAGWVWRVRGDHPLAKENAEKLLAWLKEQGWPIHDLRGMGSMIAAVVEGRPELGGISRK